MVGDARDLAHDHPRVFASLGHFDAGQLLDRQREADIVQQRRGIVEPIGVGKDLRPGPLLGHFLESAMQVPDFDVAIDDSLAVEFQIELDRAVRGRMGRPHLELHDLVGRIQDGSFLFPARG